VSKAADRETDYDLRVGVRWGRGGIMIFLASFTCHMFISRIPEYFFFSTLTNFFFHEFFFLFVFFFFLVLDLLCLALLAILNNDL